MSGKLNYLVCDKCGDEWPCPRAGENSSIDRPRVECGSCDTEHYWDADAKTWTAVTETPEEY